MNELKYRFNDDGFRIRIFEILHHFADYRLNPTADRYAAFLI